MKRLVFLFVPLLASCAVYDALTMTGFDPNEYRIIAEIRADANRYKLQCDTPTAQANARALADKTQLFEIYSEQIPSNKDGYGASKSLNEIAQGLAERYTQPTPVNNMFCKIKYNSIENSAKILQHVIGNKPR